MFGIFSTREMKENIDTLISNFKKKQLNNNPAKQKNNETQRIMDEIKEAKFHDAVKYINAHIGLFTILATFFIGLLSVIIKGFFFVFMCGKYDYWKIDHSYINMSNENALYEIVLYAAIAIMYITINLIPFNILTSKTTWYKKLLKSLNLIIVTTIIIIAFFLVYMLITKQVSISEIFNIPEALLINILFAAFLLTLVLYMLGLFMPLLCKKPKHQIDYQFYIHKIFDLRIIYALIIMLAVYVIMVYIYGIFLASGQRTFKTIGDYSVVIYENNENYLVSDCMIIEEKITIDVSKQKLISKESIETDTITFSVAKLK